ncbi:MAG: C39 family peptidase [Candidatus Falkowbacteria bacterium]
MKKIKNRRLVFYLCICIIFCCNNFVAVVKAENNQLILQPVAFTSQAPTGYWSDQRQQDGCEEASALMAVVWARGHKMPTTAATKEKKLVAISDWEQKNFGSYRDTSASSTAERILKGYFDFTGYTVKQNISLDNLRSAVNAGNVVVAPMNGMKLKNPYFTLPGPDRHMLLIIGYDAKTKEFITNDPGTKRGQGFRYSEKRLYEAIRDYPTGNHLPIVGTQKNVIIISANKKPS